jgi:anti-anti-sigma factor
VEHLSVSSEPGRVWASGEIDMDTVDSLREALCRAAAQDGSEVLADLSGVTFMDSSGINELLRFVEVGHKLRIGPASECVRQALTLVGLAEVFGLAD